jgi:tRNA threonylcarbamoyladenosine modification (KEOPS) complex Cgi121 subunit/molybdopterin converting factor small subunit
MISIRLLGGAKKAVGRPSVDFDKPSASVGEILQFLSGISADPRLLQTNNLIVAVNGVDSAALDGKQTVAKSGDTVTVVTVVHGGADFDLGDTRAVIIGVSKITEDAGKLVDRLRAGNAGVSIQAASDDAVYGIDHALGVLRITLEAEKRGIMVANRREAELLLRLACTGQISEAIKRAGLRQGAAGCLIAFSNDASALQRFSDQARNEFEVDDSVLVQSKEKKSKLAGNFGAAAAKFDDSEFLQYLLEKAAILVK